MNAVAYNKLIENLKEETQMKGFWSFVKAVATVGVVASLIICIFVPVIGVFALVANIATISNAGKEIKKIEDEEARRK